LTPPDFFNPSLNFSALLVPALGLVPPAMASLRICQSRGTQSSHLFEFRTLCREVGSFRVCGFDCLLRPSLFQASRLAIFFSFDRDLSQPQPPHGQFPSE
jgi:hypothetical protein